MIDCGCDCDLVSCELNACDENVKCCDWERGRMTRENVISVWSGKLSRADSYPLCEMARLSRADSLVGGHLIMKWNEKWKEKKCEEKWGWLIHSWFVEKWYGLVVIEIELFDWLVVLMNWMRIDWIEDCLVEISYGWIWMVQR